jgi:hypothetical protein
MELWQAILLNFGGTATLLVILGWLARSIGTQLLAKDIERFKSDLSAASTATTERLKHDLQLVATEHQVRYSKLQARRGEVIAEMYGLLVEAQWASQSFVSPAEFGGEPSKAEKYATAMNKAAEFYRYFDKNRIFLPLAFCAQTEEFLRNMRTKVVGFGVYVVQEEKFMPDTAHKAKFEAWVKASEYFDKEVPIARAALEQELRTLLGASAQ